MDITSNLTVSSPNIKYTDDFIYSDYEYEDTLVIRKNNELMVRLFT